MKNSHTAKESLFAAIAAIQSPEEARVFLEDLCTPAELEAMNDRWRVIPLIKQNKPYRHIHEETGVSVTTIGRVARCLHLGTGGYNLIYTRTQQ
jgi:TrpR-related protein YerC/YecD